MIDRNVTVERHLRNIESAKTYFEELHEKRRKSYEAKSETWKAGYKGEAELSNVTELEDIRNDLESVYDRIDDLFEKI